MEKNESFSVGTQGANTILIVDDDPINRMVLGNLFSADYTIDDAENGLLGLASIMRNPNRLRAILLDVMMPGMTGIEVLRQLEEEKIQDRIPVFLITAETDQDIIREAYELGVMDVIRKPVVPYIVQRRVRSVIELFEAREHLSRVVESQNVELLEQKERIIQLNRGMIEALAAAIEFRNEESGGHVQRIGSITRIVLESTDYGTGLTQEEIDNIILASILHDVGKITIPDAVLCKPGKLTAEEYEIMKSHTVKGMEILESIPQLHDSGMYEYARDISRHHHERHDGGGYPDGLAGEEISPWSQIVSLADVYDALSCKRVYKPAIPREQVLEMIKTDQCGVFNPQLLDRFFAVEEQVYEQLYKCIED